MSITIIDVFLIGLIVSLVIFGFPIIMYEVFGIGKYNGGLDNIRRDRLMRKLEKKQKRKKYV